MITHLSGIELSRATVLALRHADAEARAEQRAREEAAEEWREQVVARAEAYYREFGEWEWETAARQRDVLARAEARAEEKRAVERAEQHQAHTAQLLAAGRQPRSISEILQIVAMMP